MFGYKENRGLFTDLYQLTMCQGYFELGLHEKIATFDLYFRRNPFNGGYGIACGIPLALEYLENLRFSSEELKYLSNSGLFTDEFLDYLAGFHFSGDVKGVTDGILTFANVPILEISAPLVEAQLVETALLNIINYSTLIATKASRICNEAKPGRVVEFGLRRAQGDAAYLGTRAALIGGCVGTSFVQGGFIWRAPIVGTHAHSWVQIFDDELEAFRAYARVFPDKCLLLIDTYDILKIGLKNSIRVAQELKNRGKKLLGVRIDSGNLAELAVEIYNSFYEAGFPSINIVLSNELDEYRIHEIVQDILEGRGKCGLHPKEITRETLKHITYGVGTRLVTGGEQGHLGGVYKLVSFDGKPKIKLSEDSRKTTTPTSKMVYRIIDRSTGAFEGDIVSIKDEKPPASNDLIYNILKMSEGYKLPDDVEIKPIFKDLMKKGEIIEGDCKNIFDWRLAQNKCVEQLERLPARYKKLIEPEPYPVYLTKKLMDIKRQLIEKYKEI
ncbi:MAG: nicotinate phosphoribosyltransferase [Promethearchaeota archaeon]